MSVNYPRKINAVAKKLSESGDVRDLLNRAERAAREEAEDRITQASKCSKGLEIRRDYFLGESLTPVVNYLDMAKDQMGKKRLMHLTLSRLLNLANPSPNLESLSQHVLDDHMRPLLAQGPKHEVNWKEFCTLLSVEKGIESRPAEILLRSYLQQFAARAALAILGIEVGDKAVTRVGL